VVGCRYPTGYLAEYHDTPVGTTSRTLRYRMGVCTDLRSARRAAPQCFGFTLLPTRSRSQPSCDRASPSGSSFCRTNFLVPTCAGGGTSRRRPRRRPRRKHPPRPSLGHRTHTRCGLVQRDPASHAPPLARKQKWCHLTDATTPTACGCIKSASYLEGGIRL